MPNRLKVYGRYGNGVAAVLFAIIFVGSLIRGEFGFAALALVVAALAGFNLYVAEHATGSTTYRAPDPWRDSERREPEFRPSLREISRETPEKIVRHHGL